MQQGQFDLGIQRRQCRLCLQTFPQHFMQTQRDISIFRRIVTGCLYGYLVKRQLLFAFAGNVFELDGLHIKIFFCQRIHIVTSGCAIENIGLQHGVMCNITQLDTMVSQYIDVVLDMLANQIRLLGIFQ